MQGHVVHHVTGEEDFRGKMVKSFVPEVGDAGFGGTEKQGGDPVGEDPVDLLGHLQVKTAQSGLHMGHRDVQLHRRQGSRQRGIGIAIDHQQRRLFRQQHLFDLFGHPAGHGPMRKGVDAQVIGRFRDFHLPEEDFGHVVVEMLPGVDQYLPDAGLLKRPAQRRRLDKLGSRPYDGDNFLHQGEIEKQNNDFFGNS